MVQDPPLFSTHAPRHNARSDADADQTPVVLTLGQLDWVTSRGFTIWNICEVTPFTVPPIDIRHQRKHEGAWTS